MCWQARSPPSDRREDRVGCPEPGLRHFIDLGQNNGAAALEAALVVLRLSPVQRPDPEKV